VMMVVREEFERVKAVVVVVVVVVGTTITIIIRKVMIIMRQKTCSYEVDVSVCVMNGIK